MGEIKFRGKTDAHSDWVYGFPVIGEDEDDCFFHHASYYPKYVYPNTIGQYTGLKDKNGKEIYEGDILKRTVFLFDETYTYIGQVKMEGVCYSIDLGDSFVALGLEDEEHEVIGNVIDNPNLLSHE